MLIERPPKIFRMLYAKALFRVKSVGREVYLTFDDGPIPEATPWILDCLDRYGVKATFFMVGDNARKYPELYAEVRRRGHSVGNHTMHHIRGLGKRSRGYLRDVEEASGYVESELFRPPHGWMRWAQYFRVRRKYRIVMYDLVTRDYSKRLCAAEVLANVKRYVRPGAIIVFHDSLKSIGKLFEVLPASIEWLRSEGYGFGVLK